MAEAQTNDSNTVRFFCHQCKDSIYPDLPDYTCPQCESGFIEEITDDHENAASNDEPANHFAQLWERTFLDSFRQNSGINNSSGFSGAMSQNRVRIIPRPVGDAGAQSGGLSLYGQESAGVEFLINHLLQTLTTGGMFPGGGAEGGFPLPLNMIHLHGNPADYAWGADGLDSIVTQLLNQLEGSGPPPASKDQITSLPVVTITEADVLRTLQCSVCMEDYDKGEEVRALPCKHLYHAECIIPWLERHGSCPVCRKDLNGKDTSAQDDDVTSDDVSDRDVRTANGFEDPDECD